jgi:hypothetical protein
MLAPPYVMASAAYYIMPLARKQASANAGVAQRKTVKRERATLALLPYVVRLEVSRCAGLRQSAY